MKWSPALDRVRGGLWSLALFAIGHRGPTGDDWTWEAPTPKGPAKAPLGGPLLPLAVALTLGMLFGVTAIASLDRNDGPSPPAVLEPSPTTISSTSPSPRPTTAVVRVPQATATPAPTLPPPAPTTRAATAPAVARQLTPVSTPIPTRPAVNGPAQPPTPVPTPTPPPVTSLTGTLTGGGQAGGGQFSVHVVVTGDGTVNSHFNYHSGDLRIESVVIPGVALADGPCGPGTRAIIAGTGTVNGVTGATFQVTADDCGEPGGWSAGGSDYLRVTSGAISVEGRVSGNVQIHSD